MIHTIPSVTIDLLNYSPTGSAGLTLRMRGNDRDLINRAASAIGMKQSDFLRIVAVNTAREIMRQVSAMNEQTFEYVHQGT